METAREDRRDRSLWHRADQPRDCYRAAGKICATVETILVALRTGDGRTGWGEVRPIPGYLPAYAGGVAPAIAEFAPILLGADPHGPEAVLASCNQRLQGHVYAKSAIDIALFDLFSQIARPLL